MRVSMDCPVTRITMTKSTVMSMKVNTTNTTKMNMMTMIMKGSTRASMRGMAKKKCPLFLI